MAYITPEDIEAYAIAHTSALHPVYDALREVTYAECQWPGMQVGRLEGRLLKILAQLTGARRAVEVGTFTGYSALSIAEGMAEGGRLVTCDIDPDNTAIAQRFWDQAPWGDRIELRLGPALETLEGISDALGGPLDLVFIDADKVNYTNYWELLVPQVKSGGLLLVDNVLWSGRVLDPKEDSDKAIAAFNAHVAEDERVEHVLLTVRDGIMMARKR